MKYSFTLIITLVLCIGSISVAYGQNEVTQRVERYLYTNYNTNKGLLRENDRLIRMLEERLDHYLDGADAETRRLAMKQEKDVKMLLQKIEKERDPTVLRKMTEEARVKNIVNLDRFVNKGLSTTEDALECRKIIVMMLLENDLVNLKQEKLLALLKDDHSRGQFIDGILKKGSFAEGADVKAFTQSVDGEVDKYSL